jgi:hypothetical protein
MTTQADSVRLSDERQSEHALLKLPLDERLHLVNRLRCAGRSVVSLHPMTQNQLESIGIHPAELHLCQTRVKTVQFNGGDYL